MGVNLEEHRRKRREKRLAACKHFTGIQHDACALGVPYVSVRDESVRPYKWPCLGACATSCGKKETRTAEEIDAEDRDWAERFGHIARARETIIATKQPQGAVDCPRCNVPSGLRFRVSSYNGHVHAACSTKECLAWTE